MTISHKELNEALDKHSAKITADVKEHIDLKLVPIKDDVGTLKKTVFGRTGANGMARTVNILKWLSGVLTVGLGTLIHKIFIL